MFLNSHWHAGGVHARRIIERELARGLDGTALPVRP
jgi:hypothetical protein